MKVLDTSGIIGSDMDFSSGSYMAPPSVLDELEPETRETLDIAMGNKNIKILNPGRDYVERARTAASETGDLAVLSDTDIDVIALALENSCPIVTDDYAIQNVASHLKLKYEKLSQDGIRRRIMWRMTCTGCGKEYGPDYGGKCAVCGSKVGRTRV